MAENKSMDRQDWLLAGLLPLLGVFIIFGPQILNRESLYLGVIQEQYFLLGQFSFDRLIRAEFAHGYFPLWNPNNGLGSVLLGNMLSAAFNPIKIFLYLCPSLVSYELFTIFRFELGGFFAYVLARKLGLSRGASAFALVGFTFSGYFQMFLNENYLSADFLIPLLLVLAMKIIERKNKIWPLLLALVLVSLFNSGHPEAMLYDWLFVTVSFIGLVMTRAKEDRLAAAGRFIFANSLAFFLSLPLILTFLEFWVRGEHFHLPGTGLYHYSIREGLAVFSPWFFGPSSPGAAFFHQPELAVKLSRQLFNYAGSSLPWLAPALGTIFLPLLSLAFFELKKLSRLYLLWLCWILLFLGLGFGLPGFQFLGLVWPFNLSGNFKHPWPGLVLAAVLISASMLERVLEGKISARKFLLSLIPFLSLLLIFFPYAGRGLALNPETALELSAVALFLLWVFFARGVKGISGFGFGLAIIVLLLASSLRSSWQAPVYLDYHLTELRQNPVFLRIKNDPLGRFYFEREIFPPNLNQLLGVADLRVMDGVNHVKLVELVNRINGHTREQGFRYWYNQVGYLEVMPEKIEEPILDLTGLKYVITRSPLPYHRTIEKILETGDRIAPAADHFGLAYFPLSRAKAKTLFEHAPAKIAFLRCDLYRVQDPPPKFCRPVDLKIPPELPPPFILTFSPRIQPEAWAQEPDGVWFMLRSNGNLNYARYLHPQAHSEEKELPFVELALENDYTGLLPSSATLVTLPGNNSDFDWSGWLDLRIDVPNKTEKLELIGSRDFWFYQSPEAFARFFPAEQGEMVGSPTLEPGDTAPEQNSSHRVLFFKEPLKDFEKNPALALVQVNLAEFSSQSYRLEVETDQTCWLVASQILFPGWKARLDGKAARLQAADFLTALKIEPGRHEAQIYYQPWSFRIGLYFSLISLAGLIFLGIFKRP